MINGGYMIQRTKRLEEPSIPYYQTEDSILYFKIGNAQAIGDRTEQQDAFGYSDILKYPDLLVAALADGMGGLSGGAAFSKQIIADILLLCSNLTISSSIADDLEDTIVTLNHSYSAMLSENNQQSGCTLLIVVIHRDLLYWVSIGDSHLYLFRKNQLYQINEDHTLSNQLLQDYLHGSISLDAIKHMNHTDALTSYIGSSYLSNIDLNDVGYTLKSGDKLLLCSDGIYRALDKDSIRSCLQEQPQAAADLLMSQVKIKQNKNQDNYTAMIIEYLKEKI